MKPHTRALCLWDTHEAVLLSRIQQHLHGHTHTTPQYLQNGLLPGIGVGAGEMDGSNAVFFPSLLQEVRQQLNSDHRDKMETLDIDRGCLSLNLTSPNISLKVNPTRVPKE